MKNQQTQENNQSMTRIKAKSKTKSPPQLILKIDSWQKISHGLFDYQSPPQKITKQQIVIQQSSRILRNNITRKTLVRTLKQETKSQPERIQVFTIHYDENLRNYSLRNSLSTRLDTVLLPHEEQNSKFDLKNKLFISLLQNGPGHKLEVGDFVKLGRVQLVVLEIHNLQKTQSLHFQQIYGSKEYIFHVKQNLEGSCKVCLSEQQIQIDDPLINPCDCKGSCGVIHLKCLKNWINNKVKKQVFGKVKTYNFEKFSCQICKAPFPSIIRLQTGEQIELLGFQRPNTPYILFQQCSQTEQKKGKTLHFILPQEGHKVSMGRGQNCELNISDISVSRNHSQIVFKNNEFYIHNLMSKFGTLIQVKHDISLNKNVRVQYNQCSINIQVKEQKRQRSSKSAKKKAIQIQ